ATVVPYRRAMSQRVSPGCTVYVDWEYAGSGRRTAMSTAKSSTITAEAAAVFAKDRLATWATPSRSSVALAERRYAPGLSRPWQPRRQFRAQVVGGVGGQHALDASAAVGSWFQQEPHVAHGNVHDLRRRRLIVQHRLDGHDRPQNHPQSPPFPGPSGRCAGPRHTQGSARGPGAGASGGPEGGAFPCSRDGPGLPPSMPSGDGSPASSRSLAKALSSPPSSSMRPSSTASWPISTVPTSRTSSPVRNMTSLSRASLTRECSTRNRITRSCILSRYS